VYVADHANDPARRRIADHDLVVEGIDIQITVRPEPLGQCLIDDDHRRRALVPLGKRGRAGREF